MNKSESKNEKPKEGRWFSQEQYDMLKRCSDKKDMSEWNEWRKKHFDEEILLEGEEFDNWFLKDVYFNKGEFVDEKGMKLNFTGEVHLQRSTFRKAKLQGAIFHNGRLQNSKFGWAHLEKAIFQGACLQDANFYKAKLQGANFKWVLLNNATSFIEINIDQDTDFSCTGLESIRIDQGTKQLLQYNIRRRNWEQWYKEHWFLRWPVRWFWCLSDYGINTWRVIFWFFVLSLFFAAIYANCAYWWPPGIVIDLVVEPHLPIWHYFLLLLLRPLYFSIVTMTTLGFGDMYANAQSICGYILLSIQVILGYVLLGALITRFAVLFTAGGPAGKFADEKEKETKESKSE